jgi:hypothetical protein
LFLSDSYYHSFLPLHLFIAFLEDSPKELNKTVGYDRFTYIVMHPCLSFYLGLANHVLGGSKGCGGLTLNPMGKTLNSIVWPLESHTHTSSNGKLLNILETVEIPSPKLYIFLC